VELAVAGMEDGDNYSLTTSRKMLAQYQHGWANLEWTQELRVQKPRGVWELQGNVLALHSRDTNAIHFKQLPSESRNITERDWVVNFREPRMKDFSMDSGQNLLAVVGYSTPYNDEYNCRIFLWTLSTGDPHPLTMGSHIITHVSTHNLVLRGKSGILICGDALAVLFDNAEFDEAEIVLWNWKTGNVLANIATEGITYMRFLSEKHIIFGILEEETEPRLVVVNFTSQHPERRSLYETEGVFTFGFPTFSETANIVDLNIQSFPPPSWKPDPKLPVPFFTAPHNRLYLVAILVQTSTGSYREVQLYALGSSFLSSVENAAGLNLDWHMWGPEGTRMMISPFSAADTWERYVYGTKYTSTRQPPGSHAEFVHIYEFNQLGLKWSKKNVESKVAVSGTDITIQDFKDGKEGDVSCSDVTAPTRIVDGEVFQDEVETKLGYTVKRWEIPGRPRVRSVMCSEDGLVIAYGEIRSEEFHILTV